MAAHAARPVKVYAVIPARAGSRGVPQKNTCEVGGLPLFSRAVGAAAAAKVFDKIVITTDIPEILEMPIRPPLELVCRPPHLAGADVHAVYAVLHALSVTGAARGDLVFMLLPTTPFRVPSHLREAVSWLHADSCRAVIGVGAFDKPLQSLRTVDDNGFLRYAAGGTHNPQRQDGPPLYAVNGALFAARVGDLQDHETFHLPGGVRPYIMDTVYSLDINTVHDLIIARALAEYTKDLPAALTR